MSDHPTPDDPGADEGALGVTAPLPRVPSRPPGASRAVRLHLSRPEDLMRCLNPRSTVFVLMPDPPAEDTVVECVLVHPTKGDELMLFARVARRGTTLAGPGVELRFDPLDGSGREALLAFMRRTGRSSDGPGV